MRPAWARMPLAEAAIVFIISFIGGLRYLPSEARRMLSDFS